MQPVSDNICIRAATADDIPFLANNIHEACLQPLGHCMFDDLVDGLGVDGIGLLQGVLRAGASNWGLAEDAHILEEGGVPTASAFGYVPDPEACMPFNLGRLPELAQELGWTPEQAQTFRARFEEMFPPEEAQSVMKPQADFIIEFVAVIPEARGRGLIKILLQSILAQARTAGHSSAGIMIINGNDRAAHAYEALGFKPYCAYFEEFFAGVTPGFPGLTRYRLRFGSATRG